MLFLEPGSITGPSADPSPALRALLPAVAAALSRAELQILLLLLPFTPSFLSQTLPSLSLPLSLSFPDAGPGRGEPKCAPDIGKPILLLADAVVIIDYYPQGEKEDEEDEITGMLVQDYGHLLWETDREQGVL